MSHQLAQPLVDCVHAEPRFNNPHESSNKGLPRRKAKPLLGKPSGPLVAKGPTRLENVQTL